MKDEDLQLGIERMAEGASIRGGDPTRDRDVSTRPGKRRERQHVGWRVLVAEAAVQLVQFARRRDADAHLTTQPNGAPSSSREPAQLVLADFLRWSFVCSHVGLTQMGGRRPSHFMVPSFYSEMRSDSAESAWGGISTSGASRSSRAGDAGVSIARAAKEALAVFGSSASDSCSLRPLASS